MVFVSEEGSNVDASNVANQNAPKAPFSAASLDNAFLPQGVPMGIQMGFQGMINLQPGVAGNVLLQQQSAAMNFAQFPFSTAQAAGSALNLPLGLNMIGSYGMMELNGQNLNQLQLLQQQQQAMFLQQLQLHQMGQGAAMQPGMLGLGQLGLPAPSPVVMNLPQGAVQLPLQVPSLPQADGSKADPNQILAAAAQLITGLMNNGGANSEVVQQALNNLAAASNSLEPPAPKKAALAAGQAPRRTRTVSHDGKKTIGVTFNKANGWIAQRFINGKLRYLGLASNMYDACVMHDKKLIELMGVEEARKKGLNFDLAEGPKDNEVAALLGLHLDHTHGQQRAGPKSHATAAPTLTAGLSAGGGASSLGVSGRTGKEEAEGESDEPAALAFQPPKKRRFAHPLSHLPASGSTSQPQGTPAAPPPPSVEDAVCPLTRLRNATGAAASLPPPPALPSTQGGAEGATTPVPRVKSTDPTLSLRPVKDVFWPLPNPSEDNNNKNGGDPGAKTATELVEDDAGPPALEL